MAELGKRSSVAVSSDGKVKYRADGGAGVALVASNIWVRVCGIALFFVAAVLTLVHVAIFERCARRFSDQ